ncbi:Uncharacterized protein DAT39_000034 [Clarias magur]|uniref:Uncharacterized protein n=1 Tax=Clarias magur TaxID=1594786 RepID=A0A8J4XHG0_CLAMG|nr:Uncharacterized protein DAT39_000034 [Clarias magur]
MKKCEYTVPRTKQKACIKPAALTHLYVAQFSGEQRHRTRNRTEGGKRNTRERADAGLELSDEPISALHGRG